MVMLNLAVLPDSIGKPENSENSKAVIESYCVAIQNLLQWMRYLFLL